MEGRRVGMTTLKVVGLVLLFMGTTAESCQKSESDRQEAKKIQNTESLMAKQPTPILEYSMDRALLAERLVRFNDPNKMTYLYVVMADGSWLKVTIIGKLTSTTKRLTSPELYNATTGGYAAPDEMGVWGSSEPAKVGMTTLGSLLEIGGFLSFIYSEVPLTFTNSTKTVIEIEAVATPEERSVFLQKLEDFKKQTR